MSSPNVQQNRSQTICGLIPIPHERRRRLKGLIKKPLVKIWGSGIVPERAKDRLLRFMNTKYIVGVLALITDSSGRIMLFKHTYFRENPWGIPGGAAKREDLKEALRREIWEESGYSIAVHNNVGAAQWGRRRIDFFFACSVVAGGFVPSEEVSEWGYFAVDALPAIRPHHRIMLNEIARTTNSQSGLDTGRSSIFIPLSFMNG